MKHLLLQFLNVYIFNSY